VYYLASRIWTELLNIAYRLQVVVELNGPIFWETESIRQVNRIESIRIANWNALPPAASIAGLPLDVAVKVSINAERRTN